MSVLILPGMSVIMAVVGLVGVVTAASGTVAMVAGILGDTDVGNCSEKLSPGRHQLL